MNKMIKGSVVGATGIAMLMGGFGTYALWTDSEVLGSSQVQSGDLSISAGTAVWDDEKSVAADDWTPGTDRVVPGDEVTRTQVFDLVGKGKNLKGDVTFTPGAEVEPGEMTIDVDITSDNLTVTETAPDSNNFTFNGPFDTAKLTVVVTYELPTGSTASKNVTASIANSTLAIAQR